VNQPFNPSENRVQFDVPTRPETRSYGGWVVLALIFSLMIGFQLYQYLNRDAKRPEGKFTEYATQLRLAVEMKHALQSMGPAAGNLNQSLEQVEDSLESEARNNVAAARIYAAARSEQAEEVPGPVLKRLSTSKEQRDRLLAEVFSAEEVSLERAKEVERALAAKDFISKLAVVQAYEKAGDKSKRDQLISKNAAVLKLGAVGVFALLILGGVLLLVLYLILKAQGMLPSKDFPLASISHTDADRLALRCAQLFAMFLAVPIVLSLLPDGTFDKHTGTLVIYFLLLFGTVYLFRLPIGGKLFSLESIGIHGRNLGKNIAWGFTTAIANLPLVLGFALLGQWIFAGLPKPEHPTTVEIQTGISLYGTIVILFAGSIGAPILEEIMFRGTLLPALAKVINRPVLAILIQGLIFGAIHPTGIPAWLPLAAIGSTSGFLSRQTGSLVPSIVMHAVHNFGTLIFATTLFGIG
jgi:membrane protease YdiL (CAAX protease family)